MMNTIDGNLICLSGMGIVLFLAYAAFAYMVTHQKDFYQSRRWKAALWFTTISGVIVFVFLMVASVSSMASDLAKKSVFEIIGSLIGAFFSMLALVMPPLFFIAWGTHHQLKWWLNSDDFLDKIWKDPNKGHKSPVQEM
jgi:hypothetical protein